MTPFFKSSWSLGKSILSFEEKGECPNRSIIDLCLENNIQEVPVIEDSVHGIKQAYRECSKNGLDLKFGWRVNCVEDINVEEDEYHHRHHKIVICPKNKQGWSDFLPIYNKASTVFMQKKCANVSFDFLLENWTKDLKLIIPHYDNFLFKNATADWKIIADLKALEPTFIKESNGHITDEMTNDLTDAYCKAMSFETAKGKSIFYNKREHFDAWQLMKLLTKRDQWRKSSLNVPGMDHCSSMEFCFESYLENR